MHVEASTRVSIILAGVLLKIGAYGFYRILNIWGMNKIFSEVMLRLRLVGMVVRAMVCAFISDLKEIIAYSSVVHMGLIMVIAVRLGINAFLGVIFMLLFHGFVSAMLFHLVGIVYHHVGRRRLMVCKGAVLIRRVLGVIFFISLIINIGFPFRGNFLAEIQLIPIIVLKGNGTYLWLFGYLLMGCVFNVLVYVYLVIGGSGRHAGEIREDFVFWVLFMYNILMIVYVGCMIYEVGVWHNVLWLQWDIFKMVLLISF